MKSKPKEDKEDKNILGIFFNRLKKSENIRIAKKRKSNGRLGFKLSEETKKKIGLANKGKVGNRLGVRTSEETKKKISESHIGKLVSEETKQKISIAKKLQWNNLEYRNKISQSHLGKKLSDETRKKMSKSKIGHFVSEETKRNISLVKKGKSNGREGYKHKEESKKKMSKTMNYLYKNNLISPPMLNKKHSKETKQQMSIITRNVILSKNINNGFSDEFWNGYNICERALHTWLRRFKYNFGLCETCGKIINKLHLANMKNHEYTRNPNDYDYLCISCHRKLDKGMKNEI